jgi:hypothetical protein
MRLGMSVHSRSALERDETEGGAGDGLRTRYLDLGKVALYQVSYSRSAKEGLRREPAPPDPPRLSEVQ